MKEPNVNKEAGNKPTLSNMNDKLETMENNIRILQTVISQMGRSFVQMQNDLQQSISMQKSMHYQIRAQQDLLGELVTKSGGKGELVSDLIAETMTIMQVADFDAESARDDEAKNLFPDDIINEKSVIIITSKTPEESVDKGVLRSKVALEDLMHDDLKNSLLGKKVGDTVETMIQNVKHVITVIGIRKEVAPPQEVEAKE